MLVPHPYSIPEDTQLLTCRSLSFLDYCWLCYCGYFNGWHTPIYFHLAKRVNCNQELSSPSLYCVERSAWLDRLKLSWLVLQRKQSKHYSPSPPRPGQMLAPCTQTAIFRSLQVAYEPIWYWLQAWLPLMPTILGWFELTVVELTIVSLHIE